MNSLVGAVQAVCMTIIILFSLHSCVSCEKSKNEQSVKIAEINKQSNGCYP